MGVLKKLQNAMPIVMFSTMCAGAGYAIYFAHHQQITEKQTMRQGVINDIKRDRLRRREMEEHQHQ